MINGILNIYKERGFTSHDVVAKLRGITKQKKIGHTGTLDPDAEGVLPVCLGHATKLCDMLTDRDKVYEAGLRFGVVTDTQDISGTVLSKKESTVTKEALEAALVHFTGDLLQIPPMYSAIKVGGKKLYELARQGVVVEREARPVTIYQIILLSCEENEAGYVTDASIRVACSKGTYIRTLCHDIGAFLGCGGCMSSLLRIKAGVFHIEQSLKLGEIQSLADVGGLKEALIPVDTMFQEYPKYIVQAGHEKQVLAGNPIKWEWLLLQEENRRSVHSDSAHNCSICENRVYNGRVRMYHADNGFLGVYEWNAQFGAYKPVKLFL